MTKLELLSPARTADIGIAAIRCGADAVYIGGPSFGARAAAGNSINDIRRLCEAAAPFGVKVFVTVNTLSNSEMEMQEIVSMMLKMRGIGITAFILQDCRLLPLLARQGPWKEEFHASTQCAIRTPERALALAQMGFSRLILERQLSLEEIRAIRNAVPPMVELEFFVHGALCVCYSGDCYLSEHLTGRSANRGECAQPCRSQYDLVDAGDRILLKDKPLLSLKDLDLSQRLEDLAAAGIVSFKIEGRLKNESYVANVTSRYRKAIDALIEKHSESYARASFGKIAGGFSPNVSKTFNRGYTTLFLDGTKGDWNSGDAAKGMGEFIGIVDRKTQNGFTVKYASEGIELHNGDGLCLVVQGGRAVGLRVDRADGSAVTCKDIDLVRHGDRIWRNKDIRFERQLERSMPVRMLEVKMALDLSDGKMTARARCENGAEAAKEYDLSIYPAATNQDRMKSLIISQIAKCTDIFSFTEPDIRSGSTLPLLPSGIVNAVRRDLASELLRFKAAERGGEKNAPSWECSRELLKHNRQASELMRTRYCILQQWGRCPKVTGKSIMNEFPGGLFLKNNGRKIALEFDCAHCEMVLKSGETHYGI